MKFKRTKVSKTPRAIKDQLLGIAIYLEAQGNGIWATILRSHIASLEPQKPSAP